MSRRTPEERQRILELMFQDGSPDYAAWSKQLGEAEGTLRSWVCRARKEGSLPKEPVATAKVVQRGIATAEDLPHNIGEDRALPAGLTVRQHKALLLRLRGATAARIASEVGVHEDTVYVWERMPAWILAWDTESRAAMLRTRSLLEAGSIIAARAILEVAASENPPTGARARVAAAKELLDRTGFPATSVHELAGAVGNPDLRALVEELAHMTPEQLAALDREG